MVASASVRPRVACRISVGLVGGEEGAEEAVVDFGVEDRHSLADREEHRADRSVGCEVVGVGSLPSLDEPVEAEAGSLTVTVAIALAVPRRDTHASPTLGGRRRSLTGALGGSLPPVGVSPLF